MRTHRHRPGDHGQSLPLGAVLAIRNGCARPTFAFVAALQDTCQQIAKPKQPALANQWPPWVQTPQAGTGRCLSGQAAGLSASSGPRSLSAHSTTNVVTSTPAPSVGVPPMGPTIANLGRFDLRAFASALMLVFVTCHLALLYLTTTLPHGWIRTSFPLTLKLKKPQADTLGPLSLRSSKLSLVHFAPPRLVWCPNPIPQRDIA